MLQTLKLTSKNQKKSETKFCRFDSCMKKSHILDEYNYHLMRRNGRHLRKDDSVEIIERSHFYEQLQNYDPEVKVKSGNHQAAPRAPNDDGPGGNPINEIFGTSI